MNKMMNIINEYENWMEKFNSLSKELLDIIAKEPDEDDFDWDLIWDEDEEYMSHLKEIAMKRVDLYDRLFTLQIDYKRNWLDTNKSDIINELIKKDIVKIPEKVAVPFSDRNLMIDIAARETMKLISEDQVNEFINTIRKILDIIDDEYEGYQVKLYIEEHLDYLQVVNTNWRNRIYDGCESVLAMDLMENYGFWSTWKEGFLSCLYHFANAVDDIFLRYVTEE